MKMNSVIAVLLFCVLINAQPTADQQAAFLKGHNDMRAKYGVSAISWNSDASSTAQTHANKCQFEHSSGSGYGENIYASTGSSLSVSDATATLNSWNKEEANFNCLSGSCSGTCGHFTQVTWSSSTGVGCAMAICPESSSPFLAQGFKGSWKFAVCNYSPPGNSGGRPFPVGNCPSSSSAGSSKSATTTQSANPTRISNAASSSRSNANTASPTSNDSKTEERTSRTLAPEPTQPFTYTAPQQTVTLASLRVVGSLLMKDAQEKMDLLEFVLFATNSSRFVVDNVNTTVSGKRATETVINFHVTDVENSSASSLVVLKKLNDQIVNQPSQLPFTVTELNVVAVNYAADATFQQLRSQSGSLQASESSVLKFSAVATVLSVICLMTM